MKMLPISLQSHLKEISLSKKLFWCCINHTLCLNQLLQFLILLIFPIFLLQAVTVERMKTANVPLQQPGLMRRFETAPTTDGVTKGSAKGHGCAHSAVNTWQGQNPSGGAGALPNIALVHVGTMGSCQKLLFLCTV